MPVFTSSIEVTADYPTIKPSLNFDFAKTRSLSSSIVHILSLNDSNFGFEGLRTSYIGKDGLVKYASANEPRFDHDPDTLESLGLLLEDDATNNALYSDDFNNAAWVKQTGHGLTSNTTIAPDGTQTADTFNRGATNQYIYQSIGVTGLHTLSVWVKSPSGAGNQNFVMQHFNTTDNALGNTTFTATEEWQRFSIQASPTVGGGWYPCIPSTIGQDMHVWGAQVEAGSFQTSYIPTKNLAVTRGNHITLCRNDNVLLSGDITIVAEYKIRMTASNQWNRLFGLGENSSDIRPFLNSNGNITWYNFGTNAPTTDWSALGLSVPDNTSFKFALAIRQNAANSVSVNGTTVSTQSNSNPGDLVNWNQLYFGWASTGNNPRYMNGHIKSFRIYNEALTDAQLQLLTA